MSSFCATAYVRWKLPSKSISSLLFNGTACILTCVLEILIKKKKPILVEKPVSIGTNYLGKYSEYYPNYVNVAYNRRFYESINEVIKL